MPIMIPIDKPSKPVSPERVRHAYKRVSRSRLTIASFCRFFGHLILKTTPVIAQPEDNVKTAAVTPDGYVYYNADYLDTLSDPEVAGLTIHETLHVALLCWRLAVSRYSLRTIIRTRRQVWPFGSD